MKPQIDRFNVLTEMLIHKYERYLPNAFDESLTILEKINKVIEHLNQIGKITNDVVSQWNEVVTWIIEDGLAETINHRLSEMEADGSLEKIINIGIIGSLGDLKTVYTDDLVGAINENSDLINAIELSLTTLKELIDGDVSGINGRIQEIDNDILDINESINVVNNNIVEVNDNVDSVNNKVTNITKSVKDFGAVGDGVTNDSESLQNAFNSGFNLIFEKGKTYIADNLIISGEHFSIDGNNATIKTSLSTSSCIVIESSARNILIHSFNFVGSMTVVNNDKCAGILIKNHTVNEGRNSSAKDIEISHCNFLGNFIFSIIANGCTGLKIHDCFGTGNRYNANVQAGGYFILLQTCYDVEIYNNKAIATATDRHAVYVSCNPYTTTSKINENVTIRDNIFDWSLVNTTGFEAVITCRSTKNLTIINNKIKGGYGGISLVPSNGNCENVIISGNTLVDLLVSSMNEMTGIACSLSDVAGGHKCVNVKITNNIIKSSYLSGKPLHAITLVDTVNFEVTNNIVHLIGNGSYGVYLFQTTNGIIGNNTLNGGSKALTGLCFISVADIQINPNNIEGYANKELYYGDTPPLRVRHGYPRTFVVHSDGAGGVEIRHDNEMIGEVVTSGIYGCDIKFKKSWIVNQYKANIFPVYGMKYAMGRSVDVVENVLSFNILDSTDTQKPLATNAMEFIVFLFE